MKPHSQPDAAHQEPDEAALVDPEAYDASEQQFAASLEESGTERGKETASSAQSEESIGPAVHLGNAPGANSEALNPCASTRNAGQPQRDNPETWREEVAARLNSYRARRRPREPRYPSLQLRFEPTDPDWNVVPVSQETSSHLILDGSAAAARVANDGWPSEPTAVQAPATEAPAETTARVIPFRRSSSAPPKPLEELAEPLQLFPRILEVPEVAPPPPALGGILIEPEAEPPNVRRPGIEIPLQTSLLSQRCLAAAIDGLVVASAFCLFAYICFRITATIPPFKTLAETSALILGILWAGYQYLLLTYTGTTPGLKLARLRLSRFDGSSVPRGVRRWRTFASFLSALSLGLGYAWCMLDEDQLCWHDRITKTHLAPKY